MTDSERTTWAAEARRVAIEECAKIAEDFGPSLNSIWAHNEAIARAIRSLLDKEPG